MLHEIRQGMNDKVSAIVQNNQTYSKVYKGSDLVFDINVKTVGEENVLNQTEQEKQIIKKE